jgi:hypothetical protein
MFKKPINHYLNRLSFHLLGVRNVTKFQERKDDIRNRIFNIFSTERDFLWLSSFLMRSMRTKSPGFGLAVKCLISWAWHISWRHRGANMNFFLLSYMINHIKHLHQTEPELVLSWVCSYPAWNYIIIYAYLGIVIRVKQRHYCHHASGSFIPQADEKMTDWRLFYSASDLRPLWTLQLSPLSSAFSVDKTYSFF